MTVTEGNAGTVDATFTVGLSAASGREITVDFATADDTATLADYASSQRHAHLRPGRHDEDAHGASARRLAR